MSAHYIKLQGVGRWRPALLFILLPMLVGLTFVTWMGVPVHAQEPSPTFAAEQVTVPTTPPSAAFGRGSYEQNCAPCHGVTGGGDGPTAPSLPYSPTQFADLAAVWALSPAEMFHTTKFGRIERLMPPWQSQLSDDEIWQTVMYAWSLHTDPIFVAGGQTLYAEQCAACHGETGAGDGPNAPVDLVDLSDPAYAITRSQEDWLAGWQAAHPELGQGWSEEEQRQVLEYIRTFSYIPAWESGYRAGSGVINGTVTHGTAGETLPPGLEVTLDVYEHFTLIETFTTTVDATGNFTFTALSVAENISYLASTEFEGIRYSSGLIILTEAAPQATAVIVVYATTSEPPEIRIDRTDWIIDDQPGALLVAQVYYFGSAGDRTFFGAPVEGLEMPATVAIQLPLEAEQVTFEGGLLGGRYQQVGDLYYDTAPLIPGEGTKQILVRFLLPYDDTSIEYTQEFLYPTGEINLLVAELPQLEATVTPRDGEPWEVIETQEFQGRSYRLFREADLPPTEIVVSLNGLLAANAVDPRADANTTANATGTGGTTAPGLVIAPAAFAPWMAWSVGGLSLLLLAGGTAWAWRGGRMQLAERPLDVRQEMDAVARRIAQLDDRHALGQLDRASWQHQRSQLKARLLEMARRAQ
jgi:mono/diheme cytochrome c family protein